MLPDPRRGRLKPSTTTTSTNGLKADKPNEEPLLPPSGRTAEKRSRAAGGKRDMSKVTVGGLELSVVRGGNKNRGVVKGEQAGPAIPRAPARKRTKLDCPAAAATTTTAAAAAAAANGGRPRENGKAGPEPVEREDQITEYSDGEEKVVSPTAAAMNGARSSPYPPRGPSEKPMGITPPPPPATSPAPGSAMPPNIMFPPPPRIPRGPKVSATKAAVTPPTPTAQRSTTGPGVSISTSSNTTLATNSQVTAPASKAPAVDAIPPKPEGAGKGRKRKSTLDPDDGPLKSKPTSVKQPDQPAFDSRTKGKPASKGKKQTSLTSFLTFRDGSKKP